MFLYQVGLHGNEQVTCCTVGRLHLSHEVLHAEIYTDVSNICNERSLKSLFTSSTQRLLLLLTSGEVLLFVNLADGSAVVFQLAHPLLCFLELVLQILLQKQNHCFFILYF